jgi:hypothetical protein
MERFITRDPWESDKRVEPNWWLKEDVCDYCDYRSSGRCDYCHQRKRKGPLIPIIY